MKTYLKPTTKIHEASVTQLLAESLKISNTPVDGSQALGKEDASWDIWDSEE